MLIDVTGEQGVLEHVQALRAADASLRPELLNVARSNIEGTWVPALSARAQNAQDNAIIVAGAHALVGAEGFIVMAGQSGIPLSGGLIPSDKWYAGEFGARTRRATITSTSRRGKRYSVTKMLNRGLHSRQKYGRIGFDAASEVGTELVRAWIKTTAELYRNAVGDPDRG